jgi:hypothetical protein
MKESGQINQIQSIWAAGIGGFLGIILFSKSKLSTRMLPLGVVFCVHPATGLLFEYPDHSRRYLYIYLLVVSFYWEDQWIGILVILQCLGRIKGGGNISMYRYCHALDHDIDNQPQPT